MSDPAIIADRIFKKFRRGARHDSLRDAVAAWLRFPSHADRNATLRHAEFWAVEDVSFRVERGEALGIIGPNGAGKSTILKLLAGIMRPNRGKLTLGGRVSALIEVGAGFHPDLTGRENVYLNASILGMPRADVRRKFDDIVEFAGIRDFLDTPIKRYSSGMYARLGFAVAAHVDPQVLLVDEVLAVGDRAFRARCMDRMRSFLKQGVAIVFVSHDLCTVSGFCDRALVLAAGRSLFQGSAREAVGHYHTACIERSLLPEARERDLVTVGPLTITHADGGPSRRLAPGDDVCVEFDVRFDMRMARPSFGLSLMRADDHLVVFETSSTRVSPTSIAAAPGSVQRVRYRLRLNVPPGEYRIGCHVRDRDETRYAAMQEDAARIVVHGVPVSGGMADLAPRVSIEDSTPPDAPDAAVRRDAAVPVAL